VPPARRYLRGGQVLVRVLPHQLGKPLGEALLRHDIVLRHATHLLLDQPPQRLDRQVRVTLFPHPRDERLIQVRQVRPTDPGRLVDVRDAARLNRPGGQRPEV
jgi:hypothetical protein